MTTKECIKCFKEFPIENFRVTKKYKETIYRHSTCRDCDRGHGRGFAGKINDDEKKALMASGNPHSVASWVSSAKVSVVIMFFE